MIRIAPVLVALALAACSQEPAEQESADDYAARIGGEAPAAGGTTSALDPSQPTMDMPNTAQAVPPSGADVTELQKLGDIAGVNLGPREGGCTFMTGSTEMLVAVAMKERAMGGKAVIRIGDGLVLLDSGPGGLAALRDGMVFRGEGFEVDIAPAGGAAQSRPATVTVTAEDGESQTYSGSWICA